MGNVYLLQSGRIDSTKNYFGENAPREISLLQILPQFKILASTATYLERVFVGVFTATRFVAILTAGLVHPAVGIFISLFIIFVGSLVLVFTQQISAAAVWAGVILQAVIDIFFLIFTQVLNDFF